MKYKKIQSTKRGRYIAELRASNSMFDGFGYILKSYHSSADAARAALSSHRKEANDNYPIYDTIVGKVYKYSPFYSRKRRRK